MLSSSNQTLNLAMNLRQSCGEKERSRYQAITDLQLSSPFVLRRERTCPGVEKG